MNRPVVDITNSQSNKFVMGVKIKATSKLKLNDSPVYALASGFSFECNKFDIIVSTLILKKFILQVVSWGRLESWANINFAFNKSCQGTLGCLPQAAFLISQGERDR